MDDEKKPSKCCDILSVANAEYSVALSHPSLISLYDVLRKKNGLPDFEIFGHDDANMISKFSNKELFTADSRYSLAIPITEHPAVKPVIESFVREYQSQHGVKILTSEWEVDQMGETGRNMTSALYRLRFPYEKNGKNGQSSVVLKIPKTDVPLFETYRLHEKELYMYQTVLPRLQQLTSAERLFPNCYAFGSDGTLILENLQESSFALPPKDSIFDLNECKVVLKTMGRFHALSVKYLRTYGHDELDATMNLPSNSSSYGIFASIFGKIKKYVVPKLSESQLRQWTQFERLGEQVVAHVYTGVPEDGFVVIRHGDLQYNNMLLRNGECKLIDFQICRRGSPVLDLIYFIVLSVEFEVFRKHRDAIFDYYLQILNTTLEELECPERYSRSELDNDFELNNQYLIFVLSAMMPILKVGMTRVQNWSDDTENEFDKFIKSEEYIAFYKNWLDAI